MGKSLLYQYLKEKNNNKYLRNNIIYEDEARKITVHDLYRHVNRILPLIKVSKLAVNNTTNPLYVVNSVESIAGIIATLEAGLTPILVDGKEFQRQIRTKMKRPAKNIPELLRSINVVEDVVDIQDDVTENRTITGTPGIGKIGLLSSGSTSDSKLIFVSEEDIVNNALRDSQDNRYRVIYNTTPLCWISSLYSNVFLPIVSDSCTAKIYDSFDMNEAYTCTDVYLPRNYQDVLTTYIEPQQHKLKNIYVLGETNNMDTIKYIKSKLKTSGVSIINAYGSTECGGLVSKYEIKDSDAITIYYYDIENDLVIYSYDNIHFFKKDKNILSELTSDEINNLDDSLRFEALPCGTTDDIVKVENINIGEGIVNNYPTGDVFMKVDGKLYILGRKTDLVNHTSLPYLDNIITTLIDRRCATFVKDGEIYLAVKLNKLYGGRDRSFRKIIKKAKEINEIIKNKYPVIKEVIYLQDKEYPLSEGLKKVKRRELINSLNNYDIIRNNIYNYEAILKNNINEACTNKLGFIPNYTLDSDYNIIIPFDQISEEQIIDLLNPLHIMNINKKDDEKAYYLYYDDNYFFEEKKFNDYKKSYLEQYKELVKYQLFINKLKLDRHGFDYSLGLPHDITAINTYGISAYAVVGVDENGDTLLYYFFFDSYRNGYIKPLRDVIEEVKEDTLEDIKRIFKDINYGSFIFPVFVNPTDIYVKEPSLITIKPDDTIIAKDQFDYEVGKSYLYYRDYQNNKTLIK